MSCGKRVGCSRQGPPYEKVLVAAKESVGRHIRLRDPNSEHFVFGQLTDFSVKTGQHKFTSGNEVEEWVSLEDRVYYWESSISNDSPPNPTYKNFPGNIEAVGWKVRVYWNKMGRWYTGFVRQFDPSTGEHLVRFCDGDIVKYQIKHEAVYWIHNEGDVSRRKKESQNYLHDDDDDDSDDSSEPHNIDTSRMEVDDCPGTLSKDTPLNPMMPIDGTMAILCNSNSGDERRSGEMMLRPRKPVILDRMEEQIHHNHPGHSITNSSIRIYWSGNSTYYKATITHYLEGSRKHRITYEDQRQHEVNLKSESFEWLGPKGITAGYTLSMKNKMISLGAENVRETRGIRPTTSAQDLEILNQPEECVGRKVYIYWDATVDYCEAEVLAYDSNKHLHFLWYRDGELEWLDLEKESLYWGDNTREVRRFAAGLNDGEAIPSGKNAVGWKISVFWKDDVKFYDGRITKYDGSTGRHRVLYDDNDTEVLSLWSEKVIWKPAPPSVISADNVQLIDSDNEERSHKSASNMKKSFSTTTSPNRKTARGIAANPKNKRPRLPTVTQTEPLKTSVAGSAVDSATSSSEVAKENKSHEETTGTANCLLIQQTSSLESETNAPSNPLIKTEDKEFSSSCYQQEVNDPVGPLVATGVKRLNEEVQCCKPMTTEDEILELFHIKKIPKGPLGPVDETRFARLPQQFGGGAVHFRIIAGSDQSIEEKPKCEHDRLLEFVMEHQSAGSRIGRVPLVLDLHSTMNVVSGESLMTGEYPTKEVCQNTVAAVRYPMDSPLRLYSESPLNTPMSNKHRNKGRKKTARSSGGRRKLHSVSSFPINIHNRVIHPSTGRLDERRPVSVNELVSLAPPLCPQSSVGFQYMSSTRAHLDWSSSRSGISGSPMVASFNGLGTPPPVSSLPPSQKLQKGESDCVSHQSVPLHLSSLELDYSGNMLDAAGKMKSTSDGVCSVELGNHPTEEESGSNIGGEDEKVPPPLQNNEEVRLNGTGNLMSTVTETSPMNLTII
eukprot:g3109.t1